jgi:hypothetical protein
MLNKYVIGNNRYLVVKKQNEETFVTTFEDGSSKAVRFSAKRWVQFVLMVPMVDGAVRQMVNKQVVRLQTHVDGTCR